MSNRKSIRNIALIIAAVLALALVLALVLNLTGVTKPYVRTLHKKVTAESISQLDEYPSLRSVNLSGSTCYDEIEAFIASHPDIEVTYTVSLGSCAVDALATEIALPAKGADPAAVLENLRYIRNVTDVDLSNVAFTHEQIAALVKTYPDVMFHYSVEVLGKPVDGAVTELDLSDAPPAQMADVKSALELLPRVERVNLSGSTCYDEIEAFIASRPDIEVTYTVSMGDYAVDSQATEVGLPAPGCDPAMVLENLEYLRHVTDVDLSNADFGHEQIAALLETYPDVVFHYSVDVLGTMVDGGATELDLSGMRPEQVADALYALELLPRMERVELSGNGGQSALSLADVKALKDGAPQAGFHYSFQLFGQALDTDMERMEYYMADIGNDGVEQIRQAMDIMDKCSYVKLEKCGIDSEVMAKLRDDYPERSVVWRVYFAEGMSSLTDADTVLATFSLKDGNCSELKYCTEVKYMDIGHNSTLQDVSFLAYMPKLEILILSGSPVTDLTPLANCHALNFLELCFCGRLEDISPVKDLENLEYLNISFTNVSDISPADGLTMKRFMFFGNDLSAETIRNFEEAHPDCWNSFEGKQPYGYGWRYDDDGITFSDIYRRVREVFDYEHGFYSHE